MNKAGSARPVIIGLCITDHRNESKLGVRLLPALGKRRLVEILGPPTTPVEDHRSLNIFKCGMLNHGLNRRKASTTCHENHRLSTLLTQEKSTLRALKAQDIFFLHSIDRRRAGTEDCVGKRAAWRMTDMKFYRPLLMRRRRHGVASTLTIFKQNIDILAREKFKLLACRQLEFHNHHVGRYFLNALYATRHLANRDHALGGHDSGLHYDIHLRRCATDQHTALGTLIIGECFLLIVAVIDLAFKQL